MTFVVHVFYKWFRQAFPLANVHSLWIYRELLNELFYYFLKIAVLVITGETFAYQTVFGKQSIFMSICMLEHRTANRQVLYKWPLVAYQIYRGCQWLSAEQLSSQHSSSLFWRPKHSISVVKIFYWSFVIFKWSCLLNCGFSIGVKQNDQSHQNWTLDI